MSWPLVKLTEVAEINPRCPKDIDEDQIVSFVAMASASEEGLLLREEPKVLKDTKKGFTYFERGDVLLAKITPCFENGKTLRPYQIKNQVGFGSTEFHVVRANLDRLDSTYLFYLLWSDAFRFLGTNAMAGAAGQKRVGTPFLKQLEIPLPPIDEQKRIAAILDKADAIRQKRKQAIDLADEFLRSVFLDMFGDPVTNPKGWEVKTISDFCNVSSGSTPSRKREDYFQGSVPWVKTTEVDGYVIKDTEEKITELAVRETSCKLNPRGAIVVAMYGQGKTRGKVGILGVEAATNQACAVLAPSNSINMSYLYYYLKLSYKTLRSLGQGGGQPNLNGTIVKHFPILHPPRDLQDRFVDIVAVYESTALKNIAVTGCCMEIFNALSQKAFSGKL